jgi:hypothetical protein
MSDDKYLLQEGDVFELCDGDQVYIGLPFHFEAINCEGRFNELTRSSKVTVGEPFGIPERAMSTEWLKGAWVVTKTSVRGGGTAQGGDRYPDGWEVTAEKLPPANSPYSDDFYHRAKIRFYQTGSFTAMIPDKKPVGRARAHWTREEET